jgi:ribonucleoside-diphosphate reductase alpha chain
MLCSEHHTSTTCRLRRGETMSEQLLSMQYNKDRLNSALIKAGIKQENLEAYVKKASNSKEYYRFNRQIEGTEEYDTMATDILQRKYLAPGETGPLDMWDRVARAIAGVEKTDEQKQKSYEEFMSVLTDFKMIPGGRILHGAGREEVGRNPTLSNCYVIPQTWTYSHDKIAFLDRDTQATVLDAYKEFKTYDEVVEDVRKLGKYQDKDIAKFLHPADSLEGIYQFIIESGLTYRSAGGVGTDEAPLRPKGSSVSSTINSAPGQPSFMNLKSENTETVAQQDRRGALMLTQIISHPDIERFIEIKSDNNRQYVKHANISVRITNEFMNALEKDEYFNLKWERKDILSPKNGEVVERKVRARDLWDKIITSAHASAEPGIIFWDTMTENHNGEYFEPLESTNPCGEQPLPKYGSCNLLNANLVKYISTSTANSNQVTFDHKSFSRDVRIVTRFMDNVIDYNMDNHALERVKMAVKNDRRIGLGITALGDALIKMGIKYDSDEAVKFVDEVMETYRDAAYDASIELAKERGAFPKFDWEGYSQSKFVQSLPQETREKIKANGIRNVTLLTVAPVGTGSIIGQTSSGIEPIFAISYDRDVKEGNRDEVKTYTVMHPLIREMFGKDKDLPSYVTPAHVVAPEFRVKIQGKIQKYVDSSISSTINLPRETSKETIGEIYRSAWKEGLKGITVYREGSREGILKTKEDKKNLENKVSNIELPPMLKKEPNSQTWSILTGEGKMYITITGDENGFPQKTFMNLGPTGSSKSTSASVDGIRLSRYLEEAIDPDLIQVYKDYGSAKSDNPIGMGPNRVDSIQHGFSIAWLYDNLVRGTITKENGMIEQKAHKAKNGNGIEKSKSMKEGNDESSLVCFSCGSRNVNPPSGGCREPTCRDCGASKCG